MMLLKKIYDRTPYKDKSLKFLFSLVHWFWNIR